MTVPQMRKSVSQLFGTLLGIFLTKKSDGDTAAVVVKEGLPKGTSLRYRREYRVAGGAIRLSGIPDALDLDELGKLNKWHRAHLEAVLAVRNDIRMDFIRDDDDQGDDDDPDEGNMRWSSSSSSRPTKRRRRMEFIHEDVYEDEGGEEDEQYATPAPSRRASAAVSSRKRRVSPQVS